MSVETSRAIGGRSRFFRILGLFLLAASLAPHGIAEESARRLPRLMVSPSPPAAPELSWRNGEKLKGELSGANGSHLNWKSALFTEDMRVRREAAGRVDFSGEAAAPEEPFRFVFADGNHLTGALEGIDGDAVSISSARTGAVAVRLDRLAAIERIRGAGIVASGPASFLFGGTIAKGRFAKTPPYMDAAGRAVFLEFNGAVRQEFDLPEKCLVELRLRIEQTPAFSLVVAGGSHWVTLETWDDELVLVRGERFASAGITSLDEKGLIDIRLGWDTPSRRCALFGRDGKVLAELELDEAPAGADFAQGSRSVFKGLGTFLGPILDHAFRNPEMLVRARLGGNTKGITLTNRGAGFVVERYLVADWPGTPPPPMVESGIRAEIAGETIAGEPVSLTGGALSVRAADGATHEVPLDAIRAIRWPREVNEERDPALSDLWYHDGGLLRGNLTEIAGNKATLETSIAGAPLAVSLEHCRALLLPPPPPQPDKATNAEPDLEKMDVIAADGLTLHGTIQPAGRVLPAFLPTGSDQALAPVARETLTMTRGLDAGSEHQRAPALLHTKTKESLPVTVRHLDADKVAFSASVGEPGEADTAGLVAVQFTAPAPKNEGFIGGGWQILGRRGVVLEHTETGVVLQPDTGIGHPDLLHGSDFGFTMTKGPQMTSIRVRLFCQGTDRNSDSMNFLIAHYGSQIYCGLERGEDGRFESSKSMQVESESAPASIEFKFGGDNVEMLVNGEQAMRSSVKGRTGRKTGSGLILETASAWGNRIGPVTLSDFSIRSSLSLVSPPPFSADAKREALLLPRMRREVPPRHILIGKNGDLLRGEIGALAGDNLVFRVGLSHFNVPMERIAAAVWVEEADKTMENNVRKAPAEPAPKEAEADADAQVETEVADEGEPEPQPTATADVTPAEPSAVLPPEAPQWIDLTNGGRFALVVENWSAESVTGTHPVLGRCVIPANLVHRLALKAPAPEGALAALSGWKFENTVDPNPPGLEEADVSPLVGKPAPDFTLSMLEGEDFALAKAKGKVVVLDFWATWCAPCVKSLPPLIEALSAFTADKVAFVAVNQGESKEQVQRFLDIRRLQMPVAFDPDMKTGAQYGAEAIPYTVVIDPQGAIVHVSMGADTGGEKKIADAVTKAMATQTPEPAAGTNG